MSNSQLFQGIPQIINGDRVVGVTSSAKMKQIGWADLATVYGWYRDNPDANHLGTITLFETMTGRPMPKYKEFFEKGAIISVNGMDGIFTYDLPVYKDTGCYTKNDTSEEAGDCPGIDETIFPIDTEDPFSPGDVITHDVYFGQQLIVVEDEIVEQHNGYYRNWVKLVTQDAGEYYDSSLLKAGIQYFKVGHSLGEFSTQFSNIQSPTGNASTVTCEFILGNHRGVETDYTMYADKKRVSGASMTSREHWDYFTGKMKSLGTDSLGKVRDMYYTGVKNSQGKLSKDSIKIGATLEWLVVDELMRLESHQLMFQQGGIIKGINGTKRLNEGVWRQFRRGGRIITYPRPGGITKNHIRQAAAYLFRNRYDLQPMDREMVFEVGHQAWINIMNLFSEEVNAQLQGVARFMGTDRSLPSSPIKGKDLRNLEMLPIRFTKVNIPELGIVEIKHAPHLDYLPLADRFAQGFYGDGYAWTSHSMVMYDARKSSNALKNLPKGVKMPEGALAKGANVYYVKPEGDNFYWGYTNGRYSPAHRKSGAIISSMKHMGQSFWAQSTSAGWVMDSSSYVTIELARP